MIGTVLGLAFMAAGGTFGGFMGYKVTRAIITPVKEVGNDFDEDDFFNENDDEEESGDFEDDDDFEDDNEEESEPEKEEDAPAEAPKKKAAKK
jgi:hypothetical protein